MSNWSNLSVDILNSIVELFYFIDQIRLRVVCKSWRSNIHDGVKCADKLPWIMGYNPCKECNGILYDNLVYLYDPSQKRRYRLINKFLIGKNLHINRLPKLDMKDTYYTATFSTAPTSSNCVIFVVSSPYYQGNNKFCVSTCSLGDTTWNSLFYCAFNPQVTYMVAYNPALHEWKVYPYPLFFQRRYNYRYLIESPDDGNLLLSCYYSGYVFRFDQSQMKWFRIENFMSHYWYNEQQTELETLNNRVLFCGSLNSISLPAVEVEASKLADTIHWFTYENCITSTGGKGQSCPQIYDWVNRRGPCEWSKVWIQPRHSKKFMTVLQVDRGLDYISIAFFIPYIVVGFLLFWVYVKQGL
ncbi:hypothetical protein ACOSQ2_015107 [Xanthoceras sorbifolium]